MHIDESLAKGLRRDFWDYLKVENQKYYDSISDAALGPTGDLSNKKVATRFFKGLDAASSSPIVLHREVTGKRNGAHWWSIFLDCDSEHAFSSWMEPVLRVNIDRVWAQGQVWNPTWLTALVGEHCITRMFQRLPWSSIPVPQAIFPELSELARILPWYINAYTRMADKFKGGRLSVFIPTTNGVFLGVSNSNDPALLELRTFVAKNQLRGDQLQLWELLYKLGKEQFVSEHLSALLDTTGIRLEKSKKDWHEGLLAFIFILVNFAHLLQGELEALHPSLIRATIAEHNAHVAKTLPT